MLSTKRCNHVRKNPTRFDLKHKKLRTTITILIFMKSNAFVLTCIPVSDTKEDNIMVAINLTDELNWVALLT